LQFIAHLQPAVLSAILHLKTSYTTDWANVCGEISDALLFSKLIVICIVYAFEFIGLAVLLIAQKMLSHKAFLFFVARLIFFFNFSKIKHLDVWNEK